MQRCVSAKRTMVITSNQTPFFVFRRENKNELHANAFESTGQKRPTL